MTMNSEQQSVALLISNWLKMTTLGHNPLCLCVVVGLEFGALRSWHLLPSWLQLLPPPDLLT